MPVASTSSFALPFCSFQGELITFDNGHRLVWVPKPGAVFHLNTWVATGSIHEDDANNGVSHFLEHLMFKGTERYQPGEFDRAMEGMGAVINAATWKDFTFYYVTGPNGDAGQFAKALDMHADMLLHSTLPPDEIGPPYNPEDPAYNGDKRERAVVIEEIGMREDQPWTKVYNAVNHAMYPESHPYRRDVIGTRQIVGGIPREAILGYYRRWYSPGQLITIVVGDFDRDTLVTEVEKAFQFPANPAMDEALAAYTEPPAPSQFEGQEAAPPSQPIVVQGDYATRFFIMGFHGPAVTDLKSTLALEVIAYTLTDSRASRLTQALIEQATTPNFNAVGSGQYTFKLGNVFFLQGNFNSADIPASLAELQQEVHAFLQERPITADELQRAKLKLKTQFAENVETAAGLGELLGDSLIVAGSLAPVTEYLPTLEALTLDDITTVARNTLSPHRAYTAVLEPATHAVA